MASQTVTKTTTTIKFNTSTANTSSSNTKKKAEPCPTCGRYGNGHKAK